MPKKSKKKRAKKGFEALFDSIKDQILKTVDNSTVKDAAFVSAWIAGSFVIYHTIDLAAVKGDQARQDIFAFLQRIPLLSLLPAPPGPGESTLANLPEQIKIALAIFLSYKILTTDVEKGLSALTGVIGLI